MEMLLRRFVQPRHRQELVALLEVQFYSVGITNEDCVRKQGITTTLPNSSLILSVWRERLVNYQDRVICEYLQYGFPLDFDRTRQLCYDNNRNHKGEREFPEFIDSCFKRECESLRILGPFDRNPLSVQLVTSPLNSVPKQGEQDRRVIVDLSWPIGNSFNDGISKDVCLDEPIDLRYSSVEEVCNMVLAIGRGAVIYKRDLRRAYRQILVYPRDY